MSSLTINQEKHLRASSKLGAMALSTNQKTQMAKLVELAKYVRQYRALSRKTDKETQRRRAELLKEIDLCLAVLGEM